MNNDHPTQLLNNPIYNALNSGNNSFAKGHENAKYYMENVAAFAGLKDNAIADFEMLYQLSKHESVFVVFSTFSVRITAQWEIINYLDMHQMVFEDKKINFSKDELIVDLKDDHVKEMKHLVDLTKPGPFLDRTIEFGNYTGIFNQKKLIAMAGHRFNPNTYREISAVCTHPDYLGNGYASILLKEQIRRIVNRGETPFLHVRNDNIGAIKLYQKLGFKIRTPMIAYVIKKV